MNGKGKGKVRPWHKAKIIQPCYIDDYFDIYGLYHAQMMYPGDLNGGAENVANCRCWIQYTNTKPSNLKTKGTIQVNPNLKFTDIFKPNIKSHTQKISETPTRKTNNNKKTVTVKNKTKNNIKNNIKNNTRHNQNKYNVTRKIKNKIKTITSNTKNVFNTFKNHISIKFNNNSIHSQIGNNYKNHTENNDYNFDEDKVYKKLRKELPKDFGDNAIKYIIFKLKTNANSSNRKRTNF